MKNMNKYSFLLLIMAFSFLSGDNNALIQLDNKRKAQGEFIGTYMNHVHILTGGKIIYYPCDEIISMMSSKDGILDGKEIDYDCSKNTLTADILFPPELDPMTGEWTQILPDVFNPDIAKAVTQKKTTPIVKNPTEKIEASTVGSEEDFVLIDGVKYVREAPEKETDQIDPKTEGSFSAQANQQSQNVADKTYRRRQAVEMQGTTLSTSEIQSMALLNAKQFHNQLSWTLLGFAGCGSGMLGGGMGFEMTDSFGGFIVGGALGLSLPYLIASAAVPVPYYPVEIKTENEKSLYKKSYLKDTSRLRISSTRGGTNLGACTFLAFIMLLFMS
tara:strand:- start:3185 stop:4174 length:990 start_codon:yes stop_codon:yes gene_type:complete